MRNRRHTPKGKGRPKKSTLSPVTLPIHNGSVQPAALTGFLESVKKLVSSLPSDRKPLLVAPRKSKKEQSTESKFATTQVNLTGEAHSRLMTLALGIPDSELADDGRELKPHITVKYGLHTSDANEVQEVIRRFGTIRGRLTKVSAFRSEDSGKPYDVLFAEVDSSDLHRLNKRIASSLSHTDTWPVYKPHATIAYLKPGLAGKYKANLPYLNIPFETEVIEFSDKQRTQTTVTLNLSSDPLHDFSEWVLTGNVFCPTGEGGGVDPTCSSKTSSSILKTVQSQEVTDKKNGARLSTKHLIYGKFTDTHKDTANQVIQTLESLADKYGLPPGGIHIIEAKGGDTYHRASAGLGTWVQVSKDESNKLKEVGHKIQQLPTKDGSWIHQVKDEGAVRLTLYVNGSKTQAGFDQSPEKYTSVRDRPQLRGYTVSSGTSGVIDTITHEFGHILAFRALGKEVAAAWSKEKPSKDANLISRYATTNKSELAAEAFVKYELGDRSAVVVQTVSQIIPKDITTNTPPSQKALATIVYDLIDDVTKTQATAIARAVMQGYNNDKSINQIAKEIQRRLDMEPERALVIAQTEYVRVQAADALTEAEKQGRKKVKFQASPTACEECLKKNGRLYKIKDAQDVIPVHPSCNCVWADPITGNAFFHIDTEDAI